MRCGRSWISTGRRNEPGGAKGCVGGRAPRLLSLWYETIKEPVYLCDLLIKRIEHGCNVA